MKFGKVTSITYNVKKRNLKNAYKFFLVLILEFKFVANEQMYGFNCLHKLSNMISK